MITMVLGGLWHGAAWTFVFWGAYHGVGQCIGAWRRAPGEAPPRPSRSRRRPDLAASGSLTFNLVCVGWVFFRADSVATAFSMLEQAVHRVGHRRTAPGHARWCCSTIALMLALQFAPHRARGASSGPRLAPPSMGHGGRLRDRPVRDRHARAPGRGAVHLLPVLMMRRPRRCPRSPDAPRTPGRRPCARRRDDARRPGARRDARVPARLDVALRARRWKRASEAQPLGTRRTVSLWVLRPLASISDALQLTKVTDAAARALGRDPDAAPGGTARRSCRRSTPTSRSRPTRGPGDVKTSTRSARPTGRQRAAGRRGRRLARRGARRLPRAGAPAAPRARLEAGTDLDRTRAAGLLRLALDDASRSSDDFRPRPRGRDDRRERQPGAADPGRASSRRRSAPSTGRRPTRSGSSGSPGSPSTAAPHVVVGRAADRRREGPLAGDPPPERDLRAGDRPDAERRRTSTRGTGSRPPTATTRPSTGTTARSS